MSGFKTQFLEKLASFTDEERIVFDRIYRVWQAKGELRAPTEMTSWIEANFGSVEAVEHQEFIKITNIITYEGSVFNELRTMRPVVGDPNVTDIIEEIESAKSGPFAHPLTGTPEDVFGRIQGKYCITASNIAKYDSWHSLIVFDNHDPLLISRKRIRDYFDVGKKWFAKAYEIDPESKYPLYSWNCLWRAGASIIHGHSHLSLTKGQAYAKVEELRYLTNHYQEMHKSSYYDDVFMIHERLDLAMVCGDIRIMAKITPIKEKEVMILGKTFDNNLADVVSDTLTTMKERLGVTSFNVSIILPPMEKTPEAWDHLPIIVRIVDRGKLSSRTTDMGAMELYAQSIIGNSPYMVIDKLRKSFL